MFSQGKTTRRENEIKTITVYEQKADRGKYETIESVTIFDKKGNTIEEKEFNKEGKFKKHMKYEYDSESRKIKETELDESGKILEIVEYKFDGDLKTERITYNDKGKVIAKKRYVYTKFE